MSIPLLPPTETKSSGSYGRRLTRTNRRVEESRFWQEKEIKIQVRVGKKERSEQMEKRWRRKK